MQRLDPYAPHQPNDHVHEDEDDSMDGWDVEAALGAAAACPAAPAELTASARGILEGTETEETTLEITVGRCGVVNCPRHARGGVTYNFAGPVVLSPAHSLDAILGLAAAELGVPAGRLAGVFARLGHHQQQGWPPDAGCWSKQLQRCMKKIGCIPANQKKH